MRYCYIENFNNTTSDSLIIAHCSEISLSVINLSKREPPEVHILKCSASIGGTVILSIFRQFLTSIWYPAYKVGADRSYDRCPCAKPKEFTAIDRSTARGRYPRRTPRIESTRVHVTHDFIHFHPTTRRHERTHSSQPAM